MVSRFEGELSDLVDVARDDGRFDGAPSQTQVADIDGARHRNDHGSGGLATLDRPPAGAEASTADPRWRQWQVSAKAGLAGGAREIGGMSALMLDVCVTMVRSRFAWRECLQQMWFAARVATVPAILIVAAVQGLVMFVLNTLLGEIGAADLSGAAASLAVVTQTGAWLTAIVIGGSVATAVCADLGARTIREEVDAMKVMGIDPIQRLVVPRVVALIVIAELLGSLVCVLGLCASYAMSVVGQNVTPGAFAASLPLLVGLRDVMVCFLKVALFGAIGAFIGCYKGLTVSGGPNGVGQAVNETVVYALAVLFLVNSVVTTVAAIGGPA